MRLYIAAAIYNGMHIGGPVHNRLTPVQQRHRLDLKYLLESYHYFNSDKLVHNTRQANEKVFLDSGAFSAFTQGVQIDLPKYCKFIRDNADIVEVASVLDVVGDAQGTWQNQQAMERLGVKALPCFHYGEDERYLEYYAGNYEYITLGGMVPISTPNLFLWLDRLWEKYLCDGSGRPRLKVHGFGLTSIPLMKRYPWFSVDSSSWVQISSVGSVLHPDYGVICLSHTSPNRKQEGRHFDTFSHIEQAHLAREFAQLGYTVQELRESYLARRTFCMWAYTELNNRINHENSTFQNEQQGLF
jgi:hypothetical protein